jgi:hypothetical protein
LADAAEVDVVDSVTIIAEAYNNNTTNRVTVATTTCTVDHQLSDASMEMAAAVATMRVVVATVRALVLYAVLPGTRPSSVLRQVEALVPLPKEFFLL